MNRNKKYGLFLADIPAEEVPFDNTELEDWDIIENTSYQQLVYREKRKAYQILTDNPNQFISEEQMKSLWHKL